MLALSRSSTTGELESLRIDLEARALKYREEIRQWRAAVQNAIPSHVAAGGGGPAEPPFWTKDTGSRTADLAVAVAAIRARRRT